MKSWLNYRQLLFAVRLPKEKFMSLAVGDKAPLFSVPGNGGKTLSLADYAGKNIVLYFYPKDNTPGCTTEAKDFTALKADFEALNAVILGVSKDTPAKHDKFISKHDLSLDLVSDEEGQITEAYGVWVEKNLYGRKYMGIERATFLIGTDGIIQAIWRKVRVKGHAQAVLDTLKEN
jgi:thioredoxin-dependent peroxiredoxin